MDKPLEVKFRDLEAKMLDDALESWRKYPHPDTERDLRVVVADYVHAQALVAYRIQQAQIVSGLEAAIAQAEAWKKTEGLL